ncbi:MAG: DNA polymerase III subunit delta [Candidatus Saccharimonadales bacterium]
MITLLTGENSFELDRELKRTFAAFNGTPEVFDGDTLELSQLPDILMGISLFADERLVIIKQLSENKTIWSVFDQWLERVSDDIELVLIEPKPDKRVKTYKALAKFAEVKTFALWGERDVGLAERWVQDEAKRLGVSLALPMARRLVSRAGTDQWRLVHALEKLSLLNEVTLESINELVEANPSENVFQLFETALKGQTEKVHAMIETLQLTDDAHRVMGLLSSQALQLALLASTDKPSTDVAKENGIHPFVLSKMTSYARTYGRDGTRNIITHLSNADTDMKSLTVNPWLLVERALLKIVS